MFWGKKNEMTTSISDSNPAFANLPILKNVFSLPKSTLLKHTAKNPPGITGQVGATGLPTRLSRCGRIRGAIY
jgi:hypothetical protein